MDKLVLDPGALSLASVAEYARSRPKIQLSLAAAGAIDAAQQTIESILSAGKTVYGVNTGFGSLAQTTIDRKDLATLQLNLIRSHAVGVGPLLEDDSVALILLLKINSLARGYSGVRRQVIDFLIELANQQTYPCIPSKGSVGASGDLAPLAHLSSVLIGEGNVRRSGDVLPAADALSKFGLAPLKLAPKEGLALINGTQVSTAIALTALLRTIDLFRAALVAGAMSVEAVMGTDVPFDARIHAVRLHPGQMDCAASLQMLMAGSSIRQSHVHCTKVQDPYSLRCQPQVMGACLDQIRHVASVLVREANAVSDNPLVFAEQGDVLSGGNFHAEPVAFAADNLALALAEIGALSERRIALLIDPHFSGLPPFLVQSSGLNSGFMLAQVTAAALASENKSLAHPASVDSLPTSANQEDHVSMATYAALRLLTMVENVRSIVAIELLAAAQGIDFRRPLTSSPLLEQVFAALRELVPFYDRDRSLSGDVASVGDWIASGYFSTPHWPLPVVVAE